MGRVSCKTDWAREIKVDSDVAGRVSCKTDWAREIKVDSDVGESVV